MVRAGWGYPRNYFLKKKKNIYQKKIIHTINQGKHPPLCSPAGLNKVRAILLACGNHSV